MIGFSPLEKPKTSSARQAILLPADEVRERPAGVGRDEPNQDPCLGGSMAPWDGDGEDPGSMEVFGSLMGWNLGRNLRQFKRYNYD